MKKSCRAIALLLLAAAGRTLTAFGGEDSSDTLLYWMIDDSSTKIQFDYAVVYAAPTANLEGKTWTAEAGYGDVGSVPLPAGVAGGFAYKSDSDLRTGVMTSLGSLGNYSSYSFYIELLNWDGNIETREGVSTLSSYSDLVANHHILVTGLAIPSNLAPWAPMAGSVPEPTSGLLVALGCAALLLRRRNGRAGHPVDEKA